MFHIVTYFLFIWDVRGATKNFRDSPNKKKIYTLQIQLLKKLVVLSVRALYSKPKLVSSNVFNRADTHLKQQIAIFVHPEVAGIASAALFPHHYGQNLTQFHAATITAINPVSTRTHLQVIILQRKILKINNTTRDCKMTSFYLVLHLNPKPNIITSAMRFFFWYEDNVINSNFQMVITKDQWYICIKLQSRRWNFVSRFSHLYIQGDEVNISKNLQKWQIYVYIYIIFLLDTVYVWEPP